MDVPKYASGTMTQYSMSKQDIIGNFPEGRQRYDLLSVITICLPKSIDNIGMDLWLHRFITILLSGNIIAEDKKSMLEKEYGIKMNTKMKERWSNMCNLSDLIWDEAIEKGIERGKQSDIMELLADIGEISEKLKEKISKENNPEVLKKWLKLAAKSESIEQFENGMNSVR